MGSEMCIRDSNPHDGSAAHSNTAVRVDSYLWQDVLNTEATVAEFSGHSFIWPEADFVAQINDDKDGKITARLITEGAIGERIISEIDTLAVGDELAIAMFYLSDRGVIKSLKRADERGVSIRLILDPNKDAFGIKKNGIPNRQVANELMNNSNGSTKIRWCNTHGEQCHSKLLLVKRGDSATLLLGSANFTKRNLDNYNLETNVVFTGPADEQLFIDASDFFNRQWHNEKDKFYSISYDTYQDTNLYRTIIYHLKEFTGVSRW